MQTEDHVTWGPPDKAADPRPGILPVKSLAVGQTQSLDEPRPQRTVVSTSLSYRPVCLAVQSPGVCPQARGTQARRFPSGHTEWLPQASVCVSFLQTKCLLLFLWRPQT